eukprot:sb/3464075/
MKLVCDAQSDCAKATVFEPAGEIAVSSALETNLVEDSATTSNRFQITYLSSETESANLVDSGYTGTCKYGASEKAVTFCPKNPEISFIDAANAEITPAANGEALDEIFEIPELVFGHERDGNLRFYFFFFSMGWRPEYKYNDRENHKIQSRNVLIMKFPLCVSSHYICNNRGDFSDPDLVTFYKFLDLAIEYWQPKSCNLRRKSHQPKIAHQISILPFRIAILSKFCRSEFFDRVKILNRAPLGQIFTVACDFKSCKGTEFLVNGVPTGLTNNKYEEAKGVLNATEYKCMSGSLESATTVKCMAGMTVLSSVGGVCKETLTPITCTKQDDGTYKKSCDEADTTDKASQCRCPASKPYYHSADGKCEEKCGARGIFVSMILVVAAFLRFLIRQVYILVIHNGHKIGCNTFSCEDNGVAPSSNNSMHVFRKCEIRNVCPAFTLDGHEKRLAGKHSIMKHNAVILSPFFPCLGECRRHSPGCLFALQKVIAGLGFENDILVY